MNPNERDTTPPAPDAAEPEQAWVDPWSWRAYPDDLDPADPTATAEAPPPAAEPEEPLAEPEEAAAEVEQPAEEPEEPADQPEEPAAEVGERAAAPAEAAAEAELEATTAEEPSAEDTAAQPDQVEPSESPDPEPAGATAEQTPPQPPDQAEPPEAADEAEPGPETEAAAEPDETTEVESEAVEEPGAVEEPAEELAEAAGEPAAAEEPAVELAEAAEASSAVVAEAEEPVGADEPAEEPAAEEPEEAGGAGEPGPTVGPSDWDERVRLLERVEPAEPADLREPGDLWDLGDGADAVTEDRAASVEAVAAPEPDTVELPPVRPVDSAPRTALEPPPTPLEPPVGLLPPGPGEGRRPPPPPPWVVRPPGTVPPRPHGRPALPPPARAGQAPPRQTPPRAAPPRALPPRPAPAGGWVRTGGLETPWDFQRAPAPVRGARARRRGWIIVLAILAALVVMVVQLVQLGLLPRPQPAASPRGAQLAAPSSPGPSGPGPSASTLSPRAQVVRLLTSRSQALLRHDKVAFLATVDRRRRGFYQSQAALFDRMATVPFASFSYTVSDPLQDVGSDLARQKYRPTPVSMFPVEASFGFRGQHASPFVAHYFYTFAVTASGWRIAGQDDVPKPLRSDVEIWDGGPVQTLSTPRTLVVLHPGDSGLGRRLLTVAERGYAQVAASWSGSWDRKVVILVPRDQREAQRLVRSRNLSDVAAVTSSAIEAGPLHRLLGNRIIVNTSLVKGYRTLDLQVVLTHEMTHVATRGIGVGVPLYLVEGFADYTALRPLDAPVRLTRPSLALAVRVGRFKGKLPTSSQLVGNDAALAYDEGSTFCLWVATTYGQAKLQALYSSFGDLARDADRRDEDVRFRRVLGISRATAEARWAAFVRGAV